MADTIYTPAFDELQTRANIPTIDSQNARRLTLAAEISEDENALKELSAKYGYTATYWDAHKKIQHSMAMLRVRDTLGDKKVTEKVLEAMAYADPEYRRWVERTEKERAEYHGRMADLANKKRAYELMGDETNRATSMVRFAASERMNG